VDFKLYFEAYIAFDVTIMFHFEYLINYRVGQKTGLFLRSDNFATTDDRNACNTSKVSEFCAE